MKYLNKSAILLLAASLMFLRLPYAGYAQKKIKIPVGSAEKTVYFMNDRRVQDETLSVAETQLLPREKAKKRGGVRPPAKSGIKSQRPSETMMYAAWSRYDVYDDFYDLFGFDIDDPTYLYSLTVNEDLVGRGHQVCAAAWDGKQVQFISEVYLASYDRYIIGYRGTLDVLTGEMKLLSKSGYASSETGNISSLAYDKTNGKLYGLNLNGLLYDVSLTDSTSRLIDTIRWGESSIGYPLTLSASPGGRLYVISSGGQLFRIDKRTAAAEKIGDLGVPVMAAYQSATFDTYTGELFWARAGESEDEFNLYKVDTLTGKATMYSQFGLQTLGLFHMHYADPCDVAPAAVDSLSRTADGGHLCFRWVNPSTNIIGGELTCLDKVRIYRAEGIGEFVLFDSVSNLVPGEEALYTVDESKEGYYRYGFVPVNTKGKANPTMHTVDYGYYTYGLPYQTGFEDSDNNTPLILDGSAFETDKKLVYKGERSIVLPPYTRLRIVGLPLEKGATYKVTFHSRGYEQGFDFDGLKKDKAAGDSRKLNDPWSKKPFATLNVRVGGKTYYPEASQSMAWAKSEVEFYAPESIKTTLEFATSIFDVYYLDEVTIEAFIPNTTPNVPHHVGLSAMQGPSREVELSWTNPSTTAGDETLTALSGVIVQMSQYSRFDREDGIVLTDTVYTNAVGGKVNKKYTAPSDRYWYFRLNAFNQIGNSPYDTVIGTPWLGRDTVFDAPVALKASCLPDGRMHLSWKEVPAVGTHGGWLDGEITGYRIIRLNGNNVSSVTAESSVNEYTTEILPMNIYTFGVSALRNGHYSSDTTMIRLVGGLQAGQEPVGELQSEAGYAVAPFHASAASSGMSHISQILYKKSLFNEPCIIDTLYFFINRPSMQFSQNYRIHLGYYAKDVFTEYKDWLAIDSMQEVFSGRISFDKQAEILKVPVTPFWYDGHSNLLLSIIRGKQNCSREVQFINNVSEDYYPHLYDYHTADQEDFFMLHGKPTWASGIRYIPLLVVNKLQDLNTVSGTVMNANGEPIAGARVEIAKKAGSVGMEFSQVLYTAENGQFEFKYFPDNTYEVRVSKTSFGNYERELALTGGMAENLDVTLKAALNVSVAGTLSDALGQAVSQAEIWLVDREGEATKTVSDAEGHYRFASVYGQARYVLKVKHDYYLPHEEELRLEDQTVTLEDITLSFFPFPVRSVSAELVENGDKVDVRWEKPLRISKRTTRAYHGEHQNNVCSSGEQTVAIRFTPEQLQEMIDMEDLGGLVGVKFWAADSTADYSVHIYHGDLMTPIYTQPVGYLPTGVLHEVFLDEPIAIDPDKELLVGVFAASGYKGCPFGKDAGPQINNGAYILKGEGWKQMSDYMLPGSTSANWILDAEFGNTEAVEVPGGYRIYRMEDKRVPIYWSSPAATVEKGVMEWQDAEWRNLSFGDYRYSVQADWMQDVWSSPAVSPILSKDMYFDVVIRLVPENPSIVGAMVSLSSGDGLFLYAGEADAQQQMHFDSLRRGRYTLEISARGFSLYKSIVEVSSDTVFEVRLTEVANQELRSVSALCVYPNPARAEVVVRIDEGLLRSVRLVSPDGRVLWNSPRLNTAECVLPVFDCLSGLYLLYIETDQGIVVRKVQVVR